MSVCVDDELQQKFYNVTACADNYSIGVNTDAELIIRVTEVESGRMLEDTFTNTSDRFILSTAFFNSFNTFRFECFDTANVPSTWTYEGIQYDSYLVTFRNKKKEDCEQTTGTVNIG